MDDWFRRDFKKQMGWRPSMSKMLPEPIRRPLGLVRIISVRLGEMIKAHWEQMVSVSPYIKLDYYCLMPNHLHGIIVIEAPENTDHPSIAELIRGFKSVTTRQYNKLVPPENKNTLWQASFYDEIIRNEDMLYQIRKYIEGNPSKWLTDNMYVE